MPSSGDRSLTARQPVYVHPLPFCWLFSSFGLLCKCPGILTFRSCFVSGLFKYRWGLWNRTRLGSGSDPGFSRLFSLVPFGFPSWCGRPNAPRTTMRDETTIILSSSSIRSRSRVYALTSLRDGIPADQTFRRSLDHPLQNK